MGEDYEGAAEIPPSMPDREAAERRQRVADLLHAQECYGGCDMHVGENWRLWADALIEARSGGIGDLSAYDGLLDEADRLARGAQQPDEKERTDGQ